MVEEEEEAFNLLVAREAGAAEECSVVDFLEHHPLISHNLNQPVVAYSADPL